MIGQLKEDNRAADRKVEEMQQRINDLERRTVNLRNKLEESKKIPFSAYKQEKIINNLTEQVRILEIKVKDRDLTIRGLNEDNAELAAIIDMERNDRRYYQQQLEEEKIKRKEENERTRQQLQESRNRNLEILARQNYLRNREEEAVRQSTVLSRQLRRVSNYLMGKFHSNYVVTGILTIKQSDDKLYAHFNNSRMLGDGFAAYLIRDALMENKEKSILEMVEGVNIRYTVKEFREYLEMNDRTDRTCITSFGWLDIQNGRMTENNLNNEIYAVLNKLKSKYEIIRVILLPQIENCLRVQYAQPYEFQSIIRQNDQRSSFFNATLINAARQLSDDVCTIVTRNIENIDQDYVGYKFFTKPNSTKIFFHNEYTNAIRLKLLDEPRSLLDD
ncbi:coiled-coil domain-containing protein 63-like [Planococcus citri]|uniref:coiled-coil domain-containing protein 63-like n=1 Tax=Planococcus citri TaxID=170843 RepID=UPI0031F80423